MAQSYGYMAKIGTDTSGLQSGLKDINSQLRTFDSELKATENTITAMDKAGADTTAMRAQKQAILKDEINSTTEKLKQLKSVEDQMKAAYESGSISADEYRKYQTEVAKTEASLKSYQNQLKDCGKETSTTTADTDKFSNALNVAKAASTAAAAAVAAVGAAAVAAGKELYDMAVDSAAAGDAVDKASQRAGISAESYQQLSYVLSQNGADSSVLESTMKKLVNQYDELGKGTSTAVEAFERLGFSYEDFAGMSQEDIFTTVIKQLQSMDDETERNALAADVLGGSYQQLIPLLNQSAESTDELMKKASDLGMVMSEDEIKAATGYTDAVDTLNRSLDGFKNKLGADILPGMTEFATGLTETINGIDGGAEKIESGGQMIADALNDIIPQVLEMFSNVSAAAGEAAPQIIESFVKALIDNLPNAMETGNKIALALIDGIVESLPDISEGAVKIVTNLADGIINALPAIADAAINIVISLANGISDALPKLIPTVVDVVSTITVNLLNNIDELIDAALKLGEGILTGLILAIPEIVKDVPKIVIAVADALLKSAPLIMESVTEMFKEVGETLKNMDWEQIGEDIVAEIFAGMQKAWADVADWISNLEGYENLGSQAEADARLAAAQAEADAVKSGGDIVADAITENSDKIATAQAQSDQKAKDAQDAQIRGAEEATAARVKAEEDKASGLKEAMDEQDRLLATHKISEENYWKNCADIANQYRDESSEDWWKYEDKITANTEAEEKKRTDAAQKAADEKKKIADEAAKAAEEERKKKEKEAEEAKKQAQSDAKAEFDALNKELDDRIISREEFNKRYLQLEKEWSENGIDISEYTAEKIADINATELANWKTNAEKTQAEIDNSYAELEKRQQSIADNITSDSLTEKVKTSDGSEKTIFADLSKKTESIKKYIENLQKLKSKGIPQDLLSEIMSMPFSDRASAIEELLKMSDVNRKAYYTDYENWQAEANKAAKIETSDDLNKLNSETAEKVDDMFADMPASAYESGAATAQSYVQGVYDYLKSYGISDNDILNTIFGSTGTVTATSSGKTGGTATNGISSDTPIVINVAGTEVIRTTVGQIMSENRINGGNNTNI